MGAEPDSVAGEILDDPNFTEPRDRFAEGVLVATVDGGLELLDGKKSEKDGMPPSGPGETSLTLASWTHGGGVCG
jgi:hypothetical protein